MTLPEMLLWQRLRSSPEGVSFRKQHPIDRYTADCHCAAAKLVIEVDGEAHNRGVRPARDAERGSFLIERGYPLLRIDAATILTNADEAVTSVVAYARSPFHRSATPSGSPPRPGEDCK